MFAIRNLGRDQMPTPRHAISLEAKLGKGQGLGTPRLRSSSGMVRARRSLCRGDSNQGQLIAIAS